jgi:hypothetical protein
LYDRYGRAINDCIKSVFGKDAGKIAQQTFSNAPILNATKTSAQLATMSGIPLPSGSMVAGWNQPFQGALGTAFVASEVYRRPGDDGLDLIDQTFVRELGNILDERLNPDRTDSRYGRHYGDPSKTDTDTGQTFEDCVFGR